MESQSDDLLLQLNGPHSTRQVESYLRTLADAPADRRVVLHLPVKLKNDDLGGGGAVLQLLVTWARRTTPGVLRTYVIGEGDAERRQQDVARLLTHEHGLVGALMSRSIVDNTDESIASLVAEPVRARLRRAGEVATARRGNKVTLVAADHRGDSAPPALYQPASKGRVAQEVRSRRGFIDLAGSLLEVKQPGRSAERPSDEQLEQLGLFLYELFRNTHDWARTDETGAAFDRSVRMIRSEYVGYALDVHLDHVAGDRMLEKFLGHDVHAGRERDEARVQEMRRFIEFTILDSGPGLAARELADRGLPRGSADLALDEEYLALAECLRRHMSSSGQPGRGSGLHLVQELLTELNGYLRIRSGRLAVARDYVRDPYSIQDAREPWLQDWASASDQPTEMAPVVGTLVTVVVPIRYGSR